MITTKEFLECINYCITEGEEFQWSCYGSNARYLEYWNNKHDSSVTVSAIFDTVDQTVYQIEVWDGGRNRDYRWIDPDYREAHRLEAVKRGTDPDESYDGRKFIDIEVEEDIIEKATAVFNDTDYDSRITISIELTNEEKLLIMEQAHERDITVNQYVEYILQQEIDRRTNAA
jgi:hypothetical protein